MPREKHGPGGLGMLLLALLAGQDMYGYQMIEACLLYTSVPAKSSSTTVRVRRLPARQ